MTTTHRRLRTITIGAAVTALVLAACSSGEDDADGADLEEVSMTVATPTWNAGIASLAVSEAMGYFEDEGLDMEVVLTDSATTQLTQVATGNAATGAISPEPIILGHQDGTDIDLSYFMYYYATNIYGVMVPEDSPIQSLEDLEGTTVGAISLASNSVTQLQVAMELEGLDPDSVTFVAIGVGGQQAAAVENGQVDAAALLDTSFQVLQNQGIELRPIELAATENLTAGGLAAPSAELESNPDLYERIGRAVARGVVFAQANPEAAIRILFEEHPEAMPQGVEEEQAVAGAVTVLEARLANLGIEDGATEYGRFDPAALESNVEFLLSAGEIDTAVPVEDFWNDSLIDGINDFDFDEVREEAANYGE
ncbi:Hydroxymethylpyrimidine ABC transporter, substrate-binding component [Actinomycetales bacterium JB111]|nr:Hydroxymethylpyrimidine ABC transporter, substrate-binding component [Actinomycetales bacterium JB111]